MKSIFTLLIAGLFLLSCSDTEVKPHYPYSWVDSIIASKETYRKYRKLNFNFNDSVSYYDNRDSIITSKDFFQKISENYHFPLKSSNFNFYKLVYIPEWPDEDIRAWVRGVGHEQYKKELLVGKTLLEKGVQDIAGNFIDSTALKDKVVFVNCWFINCSPCVAEMPALNAIVAEAKNKTDVEFISFAYNKKIDLEEFLKKTEFKFRVIPTYKIPEIDSLKINSFPTTLLVINNKIIKVVEKEEIPSLIKKYSVIR